MRPQKGSRESKANGRRQEDRHAGNPTTAPLEMPQTYFRALSIEGPAQSAALCAATASAARSTPSLGVITAGHRCSVAGK
jgi:hypothetical protein